MGCIRSLPFFLLGPSAHQVPFSLVHVLTLSSGFNFSHPFRVVSARRVLSPMGPRPTPRSCFHASVRLRRLPCNCSCHCLFTSLRGPCACLVLLVFVFSFSSFPWVVFRRACALLFSLHLSDVCTLLPTFLSATLAVPFRPF